MDVSRNSMLCMPKLPLVLLCCGRAVCLLHAYCLLFIQSLWVQEYFNPRPGGNTNQTLWVNVFLEVISKALRRLVQLHNLVRLVRYIPWRSDMILTNTDVKGITETCSCLVPTFLRPTRNTRSPPPTQNI